jgi:hypothetical protein
VPTDIKHSENIGVVQRGYGPGLLLEAMEAVRIVCKRFGKNLQSDITPESRVASSIHLAHAAGAQGRDDFVRAQFRARRESHPRAIIALRSAVERMRPFKGLSATRSFRETLFREISTEKSARRPQS